MDAHQQEPPLDHNGVATVLCEVVMYDESQNSHRIKTALKGLTIQGVGFLPRNSTVVLIAGAQVISDAFVWGHVQTPGCSRDHMLTSTACEGLLKCVL